MISSIYHRGRQSYLCLRVTLLKLTQRNYSRLKVKHNATDFALKHFDQVYGSSFKNWPSIRLGLLCPHSYCAVVNVFSDCDQVSDTLTNLGAFDIRVPYSQKLSEYQSLKLVNSAKVTDFQIGQSIQAKISAHHSENLFKDTNPYELSSESNEDNYVQPTKFKYRDAEVTQNEFIQYNLVDDFEVKIVDEAPFDLPEHWRIFFFPRGKFKEFPPPKCSPSGVLNYYLMDGASILPVLALNVQSGESVGDLCASPGGKSLGILFGLKFGKLISNDASYSRLLKLKTVLKSYLPSVSDWNSRILVSRMDVSSWQQFNEFDKILLDVPCTNDRLSVTKEANNIFKQSRFQERMKLPQLQTEMLCCALQALKPNGSLVYSTCSLATVQNDGVVHMALSKLHSESPMEFVVSNLSEAFYPVKELFSFSESCRYGQLVVPYLPLNYGPMYISKINRIK